MKNQQPALIDQPDTTKGHAPGHAAAPIRQVSETGHEVKPAGALSVIDAPSPAVTMFERLAKDPSVDVEKLERLIAMQERVLAHQAEAAFNVDFAEMQAEIPTIQKKGRGDGGKWMFARQEDIVEAVRPILQRHGFSLSFRTEWPSAKSVKVVGILTHRDGHARHSEFMADADQTGSKNAIQALGSSVTYGRRYTTCDLLNIATSTDDDGKRAQNTHAPKAPDGFDDWLDDYSACADEGTAKLEEMWKASKIEYRNYLHNHLPQTKAEIRFKAAEATKKAARS